MPDEIPVPEQSGAVPPIPDPRNLPGSGLSNRHKRWIFFVVMGLVTLIILANVFEPSAGSVARKPDPLTRQQQQNPTQAQIRDWENNLRQAELRLQEEQKREQAAKQMVAEAHRLTTEDLDRASAQSSPLSAAQQPGNAQPSQAEQQKAQLEAERAQQAYKSLYADNLVRQERSSIQSPAAVGQSAEIPKQIDAISETPTLPAKESVSSAANEKGRKPLDFSPSRQPNFWLPEGTLMEAVLTNRLDGDGPGPVNCMISTDVYLPGTRLVLIPQGARVLGEASKVSSFGQQRLAVAFHRIVVPGLSTYSIPLDKEMSALAQGGEVGLHDKVNSHYLSIFGASLAVGAIGGLAQIGNGTGTYGYSPSVEFRNGVSQSTAQSADRILDRFLNRLPTMSIREGTRVKILLTDDLNVPAYQSMRAGGF